MRRTGSLRWRSTARLRGDPKDEYCDAAENMRHLWNLRFAQMTVYVTINAAVIVALFGVDVRIPTCIRSFIPLAAVIIDASLLVVDFRIRAYYAATRARVAELERTLGFAQYAGLPRRGVLTTANAFVVIYLVLLMMWMAVLFAGPGSSVDIEDPAKGVTIDAPSPSSFETTASSATVSP